MSKEDMRILEISVYVIIIVCLCNRIGDVRDATLMLRGVLAIWGYLFAINILKWIMGVRKSSK